jgi:peptidyl-prolyl cis-trans isomerase SurA
MQIYLFKFMRTASLLLALGLANLAHAETKANEQALDNIVAIVNDSVITRTELEQSMHQALNQITAQNVTPPSTQTLRKQVLQHLIDQKAQVEAAQQSGIQVNDQELNKVIARIAQENHITVEEFYKKIAEEGMSAKKYRDQIRNTLTLQHLQQRDVASRITVTPEEINEYMKTASRQAASEKEYHIQDILVPFSDNPSPEEIAIAKKFAEDLTLRFQKGATFESLAPGEKENVQNNDLGWRKTAEVPTAFAKPVAQMKSNDFSSPLQTSNGFHIVHLVDIRSSSAAPAQKPDREEVAELLFQKKFEEALQTWITKVRGQSFIVIQDKAIA